jgi:hypothetical protein
VDIVTSEGERYVLENLQKKQQKSSEMFSRMVDEMGRAMGVTLSDSTKKIEVPSWL